MAFVKFANCQVIDRRRAGKRSVGRVASTTRCGSFDVSPNDDGNYLYVAVRACTADVPNLNFDMLPSSELETAYETFKGSSVFLNHENDDPEKARGAIIDAKWHDEDPDDKWVEILMEMDEDRCPKLCSLIRSGEMDTVSMGCNVESTTCSICGNVAEYPFEFCQHVQQKGASFGGKLAYEICNGIEFFEESWVYDPADPTAHALTMMDGEGTFTSEGCDDMGVAKWSKAGRRTASASNWKIEFAADSGQLDPDESYYEDSWSECDIWYNGNLVIQANDYDWDYFYHGVTTGDQLSKKYYDEILENLVTAEEIAKDPEELSLYINKNDAQSKYDFWLEAVDDVITGWEIDIIDIDALPWSDTSGYLEAAKNGGVARPKTASEGASASRGSDNNDDILFA